MSPSLRCVGVSRAFGGVLALNALDLDFSVSRSIAIVGPNGAGKTTLFNVMTGFLRADTGSILLGEKELTHLAPHAIAHLGIARTFQDLRLISRLRAIDNVLLARPSQKGERLLHALFNVGVAKEEHQNRCEATKWLEFVGLQESSDQLAGELSYGQQKLLSLACCLATDARILLLDEPVSGVHPELAMHISELLRQLHDSG